MKLSSALALTGMATLLHLDGVAAGDFGCLEARMDSFVEPGSGDATFPDANGFVTVCFDGSLDSDTGGQLEMYVQGLNTGSITDGGVHIHEGTSCTNIAGQGGHYHDDSLTTGNNNDGDPWLATSNSDIAPTGAKYSTDGSGLGRTDFKFDQGYGYDDTVGHAVVIHDTGGARVACGVLAATSSISTSRWFANSDDKHCAMDCNSGVFDFCGSSPSNTEHYDSADDCCAAQFNYIDDDLCEAMSTNTHTDKYYVDYTNSKCNKECEEGSGTSCAGYPEDLSTPLFDTPETCCGAKLGWLDADECVANSKDVSIGACLRARMSPSNDKPLPDLAGYVTVCFDGDLSATSGSLDMYVTDLEASVSDKGVHIHEGTSCTTSVTQGGHYHDDSLTTGNNNDGDPWLAAPNADIAPTGASYDTDSSGTGRANFKFDQGHGYDDTVGKVVVIHDDANDRVACGVLTEVTEKIGTKMWYADSENTGKCIRDCKEGFEDHCGGLRADNYVSIDDTAEDCCANQLPWVNSDLCEARSVSGYTNKFYVDYQNWKCTKDCKEGTGNCAGSPEDTSTGLYDTAEDCCSATLGWLDSDICVADSNNGGCLEARIDAFGVDYPDSEGYITVCFDGALSENSGTLNMYVKNLASSITDGGVHIHAGTSCTTSVTQEGHYWAAVTNGPGDNNDGDPWYNAIDAAIAPTGTSYATDSSGTGRTSFKFDQGHGYEDTVGKVVVVHDSRAGTYNRVACGILTATDDKVGTQKWYSDSDNGKCVQDCKEGFEDHCGGLREGSYVTVYDTAEDCCSNDLNWVNSELCEARSISSYTNKYFVDYMNSKCLMDCDGCENEIINYADEIYATPEACCTGKLGWLSTDECVAASNNVKCLEATINPSNPSSAVFDAPDVNGVVTVCFDRALSVNSGNLKMRVEDFPESYAATGTFTAGVHIHTGTSCTDSTTQEGHYFATITNGPGDNNDGDPWYSTPDTVISPQGATYTIADSSRIGTADFQFDSGKGYADTVGHVVVIHDASGRIACGVLNEVDNTPTGTSDWYVDWQKMKCMKDCVGSAPCGNSLAHGDATLHPSAARCCSTHLWWLDEDDCTV